MEFLKELLKKLNIKEIINISIIISIILTILPEEYAIKLSINDVIVKYKAWISFIFIFGIAYYIYKILNYLVLLFQQKLNNRNKKAIKYLKKYISDEEKSFLIFNFYNREKNRFELTTYIDLDNGIQTPLEYNYILYRASNISAGWTTFAYNLQPYVYKFLNEALDKGNIKVIDNRYEWNI